MTRDAPRAAAVFTAAELAARLDALSARLLAADPGPEPARCWCCGRTPDNPRERRVGRLGWFTRRLWPGTNCECVEIYCPLCFARWGWHDPPEVYR